MLRRPGRRREGRESPSLVTNVTVAMGTSEYSQGGGDKQMSQVTALAGRESSPRELSREAYEVLDYNQQLVQFADSKAGTLIVINSLFVAAMGATQAQAGSEMQILRGLTVVAAAVAVVLCLTVVMTRPEEPPNVKRHDLIFFDDILTRPSAAHYAAEFQRTPESVHLDDLLRRTYVLAGIAKRKFGAYSTAQTMTAVSGVLWLLGHVITVLD